MGFRVPVLETFAWQPPVKSIITALPANPVKNDRYLVSDVTASLDAALTGKENNFAWFDGTDWQYDVPQRGWMVVNLDTDTQFQFLYDSGTSTHKWQATGGATGLTISGDIDTTSSDINWNLKDNAPHALDFKVPGPADETTGDPTTLTLLNIDTTDDAEKININADMNVNGNLQVNGQLTYVNTTTLQVNDALVELNQGGNETTAKTDGAGFVVTKRVAATEAVGTEGQEGYVPAVAEHDEVIGYLKTTITTVDTEPTLHVKPVDATNEFNFRLDSSVTQDVNIILKQNNQNQKDPNNQILNNLIFDQSLSTLDEVKFAGLEVTGESDLLGKTKIGTFTGSGTAADPFAPVVGSEADLLISGGLKVWDDAQFLNDVMVNGDLVANQNAVVNFDLTVGQNALVQGDAQVYGKLKDASGTKEVTVSELKTAYDSRAQYDEDLGCLVFDIDKVDHIPSEAKPHVVKSSSNNAPAMNAINVAVSSPIVLQLNTNAPINIADATKIHLAKADGTAVAIGTPTIDNTETSTGSGVYVNQIIITPSANLDYVTTYTVSIDADALAYSSDSTNTNTEDTNAVTFTTAKELGTLTILRSTPANGATNFDPAGTIVIEYNYPIQAGTGSIEFREVQ